MDVAGAFVCRTIDDLEGMIAFARQSKRAAVIGDGLRGLEAAKAVYYLGQEPHVLEMAPYSMSAQLDQGGGKALAAKIREMGIAVHTGARLLSLVVKGGRLRGVAMTDEAHPEHSVLEVDMLVTVGNGCGGCVLATGFIPKILKSTLEGMGKVAFPGISPHFPITRAALVEIIRLKELRTYEEIVHECARAGKIPALQAALIGDEVCKPVVASILSSLWSEVPVKSGLRELQDTNDFVMATMQRSGQYSVTPRVAGGEITPQELLLMGTVALTYNLWTKITGAQRVGLFGANIWQLPDIWEDLVRGKCSFETVQEKVAVRVETQGMESGQAYGKALRAVKSYVGTSSCRFGQQDFLSMAVKLKERYKGLRAPHKPKMGVSGCMRECAEAHGKDIGLVATAKGHNFYICGNHGTSPKHATLFANVLSEEDCFRYIDRILMYYTFTAAPWTRTSKWLEHMEGGVEHLREVVVQDSLGLCAEFERRWEEAVKNYECEWKTVVENPELRKQFRQFVDVECWQGPSGYGNSVMCMSRGPGSAGFPPPVPSAGGGLPPLHTAATLSSSSCYTCSVRRYTGPPGLLGACDPPGLFQLEQGFRRDAQGHAAAAVVHEGPEEQAERPDHGGAPRGHGLRALRTPQAGTLEDRLRLDTEARPETREAEARHPQAR